MQSYCSELDESLLFFTTLVSWKNTSVYIFDNLKKWLFLLLLFCFVLSVCCCFLCFLLLFVFCFVLFVFFVVFLFVGYFGCGRYCPFNLANLLPFLSTIIFAGCYGQ